MLNVRYGLFETNSSECHALIIPKEQEVSLTKTIDLSADNDTGDIFRKVVRELDAEESEKLANWLYRHGVEKIIYNGSNTDFIKAIKTEKKELERDPERDLGYPKPRCMWHCAGESDILNLFFGTENRDYYGHDGYLGEYKNIAYILLGGG